MMSWHPIGKLVIPLATGFLSVVAVSGSAAAAAAPGSSSPHDVHCVLAHHHLYLGGAGAASHRRTVNCAISFYQLSPDADGVVVTLRTASHRNSYSVILEHLQAPPTGQTFLRWLQHPGPAELRCALIDGHLYLGSAGAGSSRRTVTCTVRFYQLIPHADGVIVTLRTAHHHSTYTIAIKHLPLPPTGRELLRWIR
jgi:hypothetical protein